MEEGGIISKLVEKTVVSIKEKQSEAGLALMTDNKSILQEQAWAFLSKLSEALQDLHLTEEQVRVYEQVLDILTKIGNVKELAFAFSECCEVFRNSMLFHSTVQYLTKTVLKLPAHQRSLDTLSDMLYGHIRTAEFSQDKHPLEEEDDTPGKMYTRDCQENSEILRIVRTITDHFISPLSDRKHLATDTARKQITELILKLLNYPLAFVMFDQEDETDMGNTEKLLNCLVTINPTVSHVMIEYASRISSQLFTIEQIADKPVQLAQHGGDGEALLHAIGNLAYLIFYEGLAEESMPNVYAPTYKLVVLLPPLCSMYKLASHDVVVYKAVKLLASLLNAVEDNSLTHDFLDAPSVRETVRLLLWCMQFNEMLTVRQTAARLLPLFISKLRYRARFYLFNWVLEMEKSPEILSYIFTLIKDFVHECWSQTDTKYDDYCLKLMSKIFHPPSEGDGNLISDLNKISSALNLARYLVTRDKRRTSTFTREMKTYIEEYIKPVHHCLTAELENLQQRLEQIDKEDYQPIDCSVEVSGGDIIGSNISVEREATEGVIAKINLVLYVHSCLSEALN